MATPLELATVQHTRTILSGWARELDESRNGELATPEQKLAFDRAVELRRACEALACEIDERWPGPQPLPSEGT